jgi:colicin import membrane protein
MGQVRDVAKRARRLVLQGTLLVGGVFALLLWVAGSASADELSTPTDATASVSSVTDPIQQATGTATQATEAAVEVPDQATSGGQVPQAASGSGSGAAAATEPGTDAATTAAAEASGSGGSSATATTSEVAGAVSEAAGNAIETVDAATETASEAAGNAVDAGGATADTVGEAASGAGGKATDAATSAVEAASGGAGAATDAVTGAVEAVGNVTASTVGEAGEIVEDPVRTGEALAATAGAAVERTSHGVPDTDGVFETISAAKATVGSSAASGGSVERVTGTSLQPVTSAGGSGPPDAAEGRPPTEALLRADPLNAGPDLVPPPAATTRGAFGVSGESAPLGGSPWSDAPFSRRLPLGAPASGSLLDGGRILQLFTFAAFLFLLILAAPGVGRWLRLMPALGPRQVVISLRERPG